MGLKRVTILIALSLLSGCGLMPSFRHHAAVRSHSADCREESAIRMVQSQDRKQSLKAQIKFVVGNRAEGWVFRERVPGATQVSLAYVGPGCQPWFPRDVGSVGIGPTLIDNSNGTFSFVGSGNGSGLSSASLPPYRMTVDTSTGLETTFCANSPVTAQCSFINPLYPNRSVVDINSLLVMENARGFKVVLGTDLPKSATFSMAGVFQANPSQSLTGDYILVLQGVQIIGSIKARSEPISVTITRGLPNPSWTSVYSEGWWGPLPSGMPGVPDDNTYTVDILGVHSNATVTLSEEGGSIALDFSE